ncbi:DUF2231 domain-containing protein [Paracoccus sp. MBLB3053]|uniref:DUF2231 domain-containing protein n=1 Tax=Paracoccus aurantius TaxID=3073814 RepID=A0ABU2HV16_9RHOB|nr:DUF2231 domain-containing protein [Paracoccus sp. MBLB3053]MDS9468893.1 DUF2231 domain-containing protein [Paracoccus sp. MBLB3053]
MSSWQADLPVPPIRSRLIAVLWAFPIACFSLTLLCDVAYWRSENLLWQNFSSWLLAAGLLCGSMAVLWWLLGLMMGWWGAHWRGMALAVAILIAAFVNSVIHAGDGWTAVVPWGIALSIVTVFLMLASGFLSGRNARRGRRQP